MTEKEWRDWLADWTAAPGALDAAVHKALWGADIALKPGKFSEAVAGEIRPFRTDINVTVERLRALLSTIDPTIAAAIEGTVARLVYDVGQIDHLHPVPTSSVRKEMARRARRAKAQTARAQVINQVCEAEFKKRLKVSDGKAGIWTRACRAAKAINDALAQQGIEPLSENAVYRRLGKFEARPLRS